MVDLALNLPSRYPSRRSLYLAKKRWFRLCVLGCRIHSIRMEEARYASVNYGSAWLHRESLRHCS